MRKMLSSIHKIVAYFPFISHYKNFYKIFKGFNNESYYFEKQMEKSRLERFVDYLYIFIKLKYLPINYHLYGFDQKKREEFKKYMGCTSNDKYYAKKIYPLFGRDTILIDDKLIFNIICNFHKLPVAKCYGVYPNEYEKSIKDIMLENNLVKIVVKPQCGAYGSGIHFLTIDDLCSSLESTYKGEYLLEEVIKQHSHLDEINPYSINSIRIISIILPDGNVKLLAGMLRTSSSEFPVDNFSRGGIVVGLDIKSGKLKKEGFFNHSALEKTTANNLRNPGSVIYKHPVTGIEFHNFKLPFWEELIAITIKAHKTFKRIKSIGWDIAIGQDGPVLIEGNRLWGTAGIQATNGGLLTKKNRMLFKKCGISFYT